MRVEVYRNLHKNCWSVRDTKTGRVVDHTDSISIHNAKFVVRPAGRAKVLKEQRKNVHAFVRGETTIADDFVIPTIYDLNCIGHISYNPYKSDTFMNNGEPIETADIVFLDRTGKGWAYEYNTNKI